MTHLEEQTHLQDDLKRKHTRTRSDGMRCPLSERERQRKIRQGQERWQERKRQPHWQRLRRERQQSTRASIVSVETAESMDTKLLTVGTSSTCLKAKARARRNPSEQVEETWTPTPSSQPPSLSQVNTIKEIRCADEGLWICSLEDSWKRRHTVSWKDGSRSEICHQAEEHELMIDSGCFGHVCPPLFAPQFPMVSSFKCRGSGSEQRGTATLWTENGIWTRDDEQWQTSFDPDHMWLHECAQTSPEHICTETSWRHNLFQLRL